MPVTEAVAARCRERADNALVELCNRTGIDLSSLPPIMTPGELAPTIRSSIGALAQERFRRTGIPYIKLGRRIRYSRAEVAQYLLANYSGK
jgi:hypothetical protein